METTNRKSSHSFTNALTELTTNDTKKKLKKNDETLFDILRPFEWMILCMIFANCVALMIFTPFPRNDSNAINAALVC